MFIVTQCAWNLICWCCFALKIWLCEEWENHFLWSLRFTDAAHLCCFLCVFTERKEHFCCSSSAYFPDFSHKCMLIQYYINHNITQWIGSGLSLECPHAYWITQPVIEICSSYVPITTYWEGSNLRGCSLRLSKGFKALPGIVYCNRYVRCNEMFCRFQAWSVLNVGDVAIHRTQTARHANRIC